MVYDTSVCLYIQWSNSSIKCCVCGFIFESEAKYRESELNHGRIAMAAVFGILTQEKFHPFYCGS